MFICEMHPPDKKFQIDRIIKVLALTDGYLREEYISELISIIVTPELHQYTVTNNRISKINPISNEKLLLILFFLILWFHCNHQLFHCLMPFMA